MSARTKRKIMAARKAADVLALLSHPYEAEAIRELCRAHSGMSAALSLLHGDNMRLRDELGEPALDVG